MQGIETKAESKLSLHWTPELVQRYWNYESQFPENYFTFQYGGELLKKLSEFIKPGQLVLDFGCGTGYLIDHLLARGCRVFGVDGSPDSVSKVNKRFAGHKYFLGAFGPEALQSRLSANPPAVVFAIEVVEHLYDEELSAFLAALRAAAASATIIITTPNQEKLGDSIVYCPSCDHTFHRWQHVRSWSASTLSQLLQQHGFTVEHVLTTDFSRDWKHPLRQGLRYIINRARRRPEPHLAVVCRVQS